MRRATVFLALPLAACAPSAVSMGTYMARGDAALSRGDGAAAVGNYEAARKNGGTVEGLDSKTANAAATWLEQEIARAEKRTPERGVDLLAAATTIEALAGKYGVAARIAGPLADLKRRGGEVLWRQQKAQLLPCSDQDPFTCQGQLLTLLAALPAQAKDARNEVEAERAARNRLYLPRFVAALAASEGHPGARVAALRMLAALGESRGEPPLDAAKRLAAVDWTTNAQGCPELDMVAREATPSGAGARPAELRIEGTCDHFDRRTSRTETERWTEQVERQTSSTQTVCREVVEHVSQCRCNQRADLRGSGYTTCIGYDSCDQRRTVCEPQTTTGSVIDSVPHEGSYAVSERTVGASLRATAVATLGARRFTANFSDATSANESSYQSHQRGSSSFSNATAEGLLEGYRLTFAQRVAGVVQDVELAAAAEALSEAANKTPLDAEDLVVAASLVSGAAAASESTLAPVAARYGIAVSLYRRFLGREAPTFGPTLGGSPDLLTPAEDADLVQKSQAHDKAVTEHHEDDNFIDKMHGLHGSVLLAGILSAGPDDKNTGGAAAGMGARTSFGTRIFVPIDGAARVGYDGGAKAWTTQATLLSGLGFRNSRVSGTLLGALGVSGFGEKETGSYYLPIGLDLGYGAETSLRITGGHFVEIQGVRLHRPKSERGAGELPVQQVYRAAVRYTYRRPEGSSGEYGVLVECNFAFESAKIVPDGGARGRNCTAGLVLAF